MNPTDNLLNLSEKINVLDIESQQNANIADLIRKHCKIIKPITIPSHLARPLPMALLAVLQSDSRGYSFNSDTSLQLTYIHDGIDLGGIYPLSKYGSWHKAFSAAYAQQTTLEKIHPINESTFPPLKGVTLLKRRPKNSRIAVYKWRVSYYKNRVEKTISFYCGNENTVTTKRKRHAQLTALHFWRLYCETLDPKVFSQDNTQGWQHKRYYEENVSNGTR